MAAILVPPNRDTNMSDAVLWLVIFENSFLNNFVLKSTIDPEEIVVVACFYSPFNSFVSKFARASQELEIVYEELQLSHKLSNFLSQIPVSFVFQ